ncbi:hypothetical protein DPMN_092390 [Dreissena polymorpha]|uniref:Uncharacterized protein n=1 Tax=Dreissena polymorpha TaxID=45954 RepID=A0A9D4L1W7_DREPO|nr:hypothetical protein DPMN_092390 [Dreissena polymorpha]
MHQFNWFVTGTVLVCAYRSIRLPPQPTRLKQFKENHISIIVYVFWSTQSIFDIYSTLTKDWCKSFKNSTETLGVQYFSTDSRGILLDIIGRPSVMSALSHSVQPFS